MGGSGSLLHQHAMTALLAIPGMQHWSMAHVTDALSSGMLLGVGSIMQGNGVKWDL